MLPHYSYSCLTVCMKHLLAAVDDPVGDAGFTGSSELAGFAASDSRLSSSTAWCADTSGGGNNLEYLEVLPACIIIKRGGTFSS